MAPAQPRRLRPCRRYERERLLGHATCLVAVTTPGKSGNDTPKSLSSTMKAQHRLISVHDNPGDSLYMRFDQLMG
jgi:hypothetical protein